jgi:hypothetical protein
VCTERPIRRLKVESALKRVEQAEELARVRSSNRKGTVSMVEPTFERRPDPSKLGVTTTVGARGREKDYAEWHRRFGQQLREKYRSDG